MCLLPLFPYTIVDPATRVPFLKCNLYQITSQLTTLHWLPFSSQLKLPRSFQGLKKSGMILFFAFFCPYFLLFSLFAPFTPVTLGLLSETYSYLRVFSLPPTFAWNSLLSYPHASLHYFLRVSGQISPYRDLHASILLPSSTAPFLPNSALLFSVNA